MFLIIFIGFSAVAGTFANNVIPVQTYPTYQQNGNMNPNANQLSNIQPYNQGVTAQNPINHNITPLIKQILLRKLLNNPSVQAVLDPTVGSHGSNLIGQNNQIPMNLVNNYAAPENFKTDAGNTNIENKSNKSKNTENHNQSKRKKSKSKRRHGDAEDNDRKTRDRPTEDKKRSDDENPSNVNRKSKKNSRKSNTNEQLTDKNRENQNNKTKKSKSRPVEGENKDQNAKSGKRRKQKANDTQSSDLTSKSKVITDNLDLNITVDAMDNENRRIRNSKHETNTTVKPISNKPTNFLPDLNQFNNPLMSKWLENYEQLYHSILANQPKAGEVRPKRRKKPKRINKPNTLPNKNSTDTSTNLEPNKTSVESTPTTTTKIMYEQSTNNPIPINNGLKSNDTDNSNLNKTETDYIFEPVEEENLTEVFDTNLTIASNEIFSDGYNIDELQERYDAEVYEGYIEDYYPLFADSAAYNANNKEIILKNLNDNKYYYAPDKFEIDDHKQEFNISNELTEKLSTELHRDKYSYDNDEKESIKNTDKEELTDKNDEIVQKPHPLFLENPDFITRQIDRNIIHPEIHYIFDTYHDDAIEAKSAYASKAKIPATSRKSPNDIKKATKDVETVFAKSKVVAYGPVSQSEVKHPLFEWMDFPGQDDDTTYVVAKTFDYPAIYR